MNSKTCFITGANAGIGKAAAIQMAQKGFKVYIGSRNIDRGTAAIKEIQEKSGSENVRLIQIDLSSKQSIQKAAEALSSKNDHLDVLIHNAADFDITRKKVVKSVDGIETVWATNHIGPVLLTNLLMDSLKKSPQGRVITIASQGLLMHPKMKVDLNDPEYENRKFSVANAYYQSKLAQVMYTYWLADSLKDTKITANCIRVTNVKIDLSRYPEVSKLGRFAYSLKSKFSISADDMAKTYIHLASSEELSSTSGKYFNEKNKEVDSSAYSKEKENIDAVMNLTMKYI